MTGARAFAVARERERRAAFRELQKRKALERPHVLIDIREQAPLLFSDAVDVEIVTLQTGDYSVRGFTESVAIERKTKPDLVACVGPARERFIEQMDRLARFPVRALVIEATWGELSCGAYLSNTNPRSVTGTLLAIVVDRAIPVLLVGSAKDAAEAVERMLLRVASKQAVTA